MAIQYYHAALKLDPSFAPAMTGRNTALQGQLWLEQNRPPEKQRYVVIKAWGAGFWSDMEHVMGGLLVSELTGRLPIVTWGQSSLFRPAGVANAWDLYFEPVSSAAAALFADPTRSFFPGKWSAANIESDNINKWEGADSRISALSFFNQPHDFVVADFHDRIDDVMPWIGSESFYHGLSYIAVCRAILSKFVRLKPELQRQIDGFWQQNMTGKRWIAVHMRGTDKVKEMPRLDAVNDAYPGLINNLLAMQPDLNIFLLTDSGPILDRMRRLFGARITATASIRGSGVDGIHFSGSAPDRLAREVICDTYLATRCEYFLGNSWSNVSWAVEFLKDWRQGTYNLLGQDERPAVHLTG